MYPISNSRSQPGFSLNTGKLYLILSGVIISMISLTIFQDFLESKRNSYTFYFSESLLFKTVWLLYVPIVMVLYERLRNEVLNSFLKTALFIVLPITAHLLIFPCIANTFTVFFYDGRYDFFKFFSYTLAHDFYTLVLVYTGIVLGYRYLSTRKQNSSDINHTFTADTLVINNGRDNVIIYVKDILQITSATPYVSIHLENKKYLHSETLKSIHEQLDGNTFIRVHKSALVNLSKVHSFKSRLNGDYDLLMSDGTSVRLSRTYAQDFKYRFNIRSSGQHINSSG